MKNAERLSPRCNLLFPARSALFQGGNLNASPGAKLKSRCRDGRKGVDKTALRVRFSHAFFFRLSTGGRTFFNIWEVLDLAICF